MAAPDHLAAGAARRRPQLGLPLLLAPRRHADPAGADQGRLPRRGARGGGSGWCARSAAGPEQLQIMYGINGERRLTEMELGWLPGYQGASRCASATAPHGQLQLDVFGELMDALYEARVGGLPPDDEIWEVQSKLMDFLEGQWKEPDEGIWEVRGPRRHFVHSKVMAWVAMDRAIKTVEKFGRDRAGRPVARGPRRHPRARCWRRASTATSTASPSRTASTTVDASLLLIPQVGFLPATDPRMLGTVAGDRTRAAASTGSSCATSRMSRRTWTACRRARARSSPAPSGWPTTTGCRGGATKARKVLDRLLALRNDVGLLAEEYDVDVRPAWSATSRRRSPTSSWSTPPCRTRPTAACGARRSGRWATRSGGRATRSGGRATRSGGWATGSGPMRDSAVPGTQPAAVSCRAMAWFAATLTDPRRRRGWIESQFDWRSQFGDGALRGPMRCPPMTSPGVYPAMRATCGTGRDRRQLPGGRPRQLWSRVRCHRRSPHREWCGDCGSWPTAGPASRPRRRLAVGGGVRRARAPTPTRTTR